MTDAKHLDESLNNLRSEIEALDSHDEEARQRLERLLHDIEKARENPKHGVDETLGAQLRTSILNFEVSHPRLAAVMNDVMEKLGTMGI
jgi:chromosome segregation ATPase